MDCSDKVLWLKIMAYKITIDGAEVTNYTPSSRVVFETSKNEKPSMLDFDLVFSGDIPEFTSPYFSGDYMVDNQDYVADEVVTIPQVNQTVEFFIDDVLKFGGKVLQIGRSQESVGIKTYSIECQDYSRLAQMGTPVAEIYRNKTICEIIADILERYPDYSIFNNDNVTCETNIDYFFVDHKSLWEVLKDLSKRTAYEFYIDENKNIFFYVSGDISGDTVTDTNGSCVQDTLKIKEQSDKIFNYLIVQGGEYDGSELVTETKIADGGEEISISGRYSGVSVLVDSVEKNVGVFGLDDEKMPSEYDCLYDFSGRKIVFDLTTAPTEGQTVEVSGYTKIRVIVQVPDSSSIEKYGTISKKVKDTSLKTKESAFQYAQAELSKYADDVESGGFTTRKTSYRAGQRVSVEFFGEIKSFDVKQTSTVFYGESVQETKISLSSAEITDSVKIMADLINEKNSTISAEDILEVLHLVSEKVNISESISVNENLYNIQFDLEVQESVQYWQDRDMQFVLGPYTPMDFDTDDKRNFILNGSPLG